MHLNILEIVSARSAAHKMCIFILLQKNNNSQPKHASPLAVLSITLLVNARECCL